ncbi:subunit 17 of mediator complex-domain-containing protein [Biscogniauxia mediterranea]|nr:subunit 17 of mediator complex-domain-containing protein [Biscogniauxia mediterranea]
MSSISSSPFSLRPWPTGDKKPKNLGEFIARVNTERSGFRNVTEAKLRDEIKAQEEGHMDLDEADGSSDDEEETEADKSKTVVAAREEFLKNIEFAHQSAMLGLDFISLLLSKEVPVHASTTLSPALRDLVGIGTLGATKLKESNVTEARIQDELAIATGWRLMGINNMVDSVLAAAERLEKEIESETKYWADVLSVSESGWAVCSLPHEPHTLGVRFGFSESAPEFKNNSIAPLIRNSDGSVRLGLGSVGAGCQRVRITFKKNGKIVDQSPLPGRTPEDAPLKDRVLEARNTIFHQELWYELNREARTLLASDVYYDGPTIVWKQDAQTEVIWSLEDLGEPDSTYEDLSNIDCCALSFYSFMQFLLFQGHRQNYHKRTVVSYLPPNRMAASQPYSILRAMISRLEFFSNNRIMENFLEDMVLTLRRAGVTTAVFSSAEQVETHPTPQLRRNSKMELNWVNQLVGHLMSNFVLTITPETRLYTSSRAAVVPFIGIHFTISFTPPSEPNPSSAKQQPQQQQQQQQQPPAAGIEGAELSQKARPSLLQQSYPPSLQPYANVKDAVYYLRQAALRAVAQELVAAASRALGRDDIVYVETLTGPGIACDEKEARIDCAVGDDGRLVLSLNRRWKWWAGGDTAGGRSLESVVVEIMRGD